MKQVDLESLLRGGPGSSLSKLVYAGESFKAHLLNGQAIPSHRHDGYEVMLLPLHGEAEITLDGETIRLRAGEAVFASGANDFNPVNNGAERFAMLALLVRQ